MHKLQKIPLPFDLDAATKQQSPGVARIIDAIARQMTGETLANQGPGMLKRALVHRLKSMKTKQRSFSNDLIDSIVKELQPL